VALRGRQVAQLWKPMADIDRLIIDATTCGQHLREGRDGATSCEVRDRAAASFPERIADRSGKGADAATDLTKKARIKLACRLPLAGRGATKSRRERSRDAGEKLRLLIWESGLRQLLLIRRIHLRLTKLLLQAAALQERVDVAIGGALRLLPGRKLALARLLRGLLRLLIEVRISLTSREALLVGEVALAYGNAIGADAAGRLNKVCIVLLVLLTKDVLQLGSNGISHRIEKLACALRAEISGRLLQIRL